jgi:hypothetical protein
MSELILEGNQFGTGLLIEEMLDVIVETSEENGKKKYYATGLFSEADVMLRNPRIYKKNLLEREIDKFREWVESPERDAFFEDYTMGATAFLDEIYKYMNQRYGEKYCSILCGIINQKSIDMDADPVVQEEWY